MTKQQILRTYIKNYTLPVTILTIILLIIISPSITINSFYKGISIWATKVLPSLLPFFILTRILTHTIIVDQIGKKLSPITNKFYGVGGIAGYIYIMSIISGYPIGAKLTSDYYKRGYITAGQASTITSFTSTSGPLFILGTIGVGIYHSIKLGIIILISHLFGALLNGLIFRQKTKHIFSANIVSKYDSTIQINDIMTDSINSILMIGGFIAIAFMLIEILSYHGVFIVFERLLKIFHIAPEITTATLSGLIEITTGGLMLATCNIPFKALAVILTFLVSFGGLSIHAQAYVFLSSFNMQYHKFLLQKFCHAAIASTIATLSILIV